MSMPFKATGSLIWGPLARRLFYNILSTIFITKLLALFIHVFYESSLYIEVLLFVGDKFFKFNI
jgi:hypothetical protein